MKCLRRNKRPFWYCLFDWKEEILDDDGNRTGEFVVHYHDPVRMTGNISVAHGEIQDELFGRNVTYDKVILLDNPDCPIAEDSVLFVDKEPDVIPGSDRRSTAGFDYIVRRVARSLNTVGYAVEKVNVT